jgi:hypothetical protein
MSYIDRLTKLVSEQDAQTQPTKPTEPVSSVLSVPFGGTSAEVRASWRKGLCTLSHLAPPARMTSMRWGRLLDDAEWLFNTHSWPLARAGYDEFDVFGLFVEKPGFGAIVDRLRGARDLEVAPERAFWSHYGVRSQFNRTAGKYLVRSGLVVLWALA